MFIILSKNQKIPCLSFINVFAEVFAEVLHSDFVIYEKKILAITPFACLLDSMWPFFKKKYTFKTQGSKKKIKRPLMIDFTVFIFNVCRSLRMNTILGNYLLNLIISRIVFFPT